MTDIIELWGPDAERAISDELTRCVLGQVRRPELCIVTIGAALAQVARNIEKAWAAIRDGLTPILRQQAEIIARICDNLALPELEERDQ